MPIERSLVPLSACVLVAWCSVAAAQTVYKWTDDHGVVHFSEAPQVRTDGMETETFRLPKREPSHEEAAPDSGAGSPRSTGPAAEFAGPARVIVAAHQSPRTGPSAMHVTGKVRNVGGEDAARVIVTITAVDRTQGTVCMQEEAEVLPATLHPGEKGNFDLDLDNPCLYVDQLYGDPNLDIEAHWN
jgi:hypothetical protein